MPIYPRSIAEILSTGVQAYVDQPDSDPLRVAEGGDFYNLMRAVAQVVADISAENWQTQNNAFLDTCIDLEEVRRHVNPYGYDLDPGRPAAGGVTAIALSGAVTKTMPAGAMIAIGDWTYLTTATVTLTPPSVVIPVVAVNTGLAGNQRAGTQAVVVQGGAFFDYNFVVGTFGLDVTGNPQGDILNGLEPETIDGLKDRFYRLFNNPGFGLTRILRATALNVPGVREAMILPKFPAPGYVTVYIDDGGIEVSASLLLAVEAALYEKASAGEYLIIRPMVKQPVDLLIQLKVDRRAVPLTAEVETTTLINDYINGLTTGGGVYRLLMDAQLASLAYPVAATYLTRASETEPFVLPFNDLAGAIGTTYRARTIQVEVTGILP